MTSRNGGRGSGVQVSVFRGALGGIFRQPVNKLVRSQLCTRCKGKSFRNSFPPRNELVPSLTKNTASVDFIMPGGKIKIKRYFLKDSINSFNIKIIYQ
jgi:hypothetical protein